MGICRQCPVRLECLNYVLQVGNREFMILGGKTPRERTLMAKKRAKLRALRPVEIPTEWHCVVCLRPLTTKSAKKPGYAVHEGRNHCQGCNNRARKRARKAAA